MKCAPSASPLIGLTSESRRGEEHASVGTKMGVDFSFSDEFRIDHAFTVRSISSAREMDLPIVPIFTNVMAPPVPPAQRFFEVGKAIRRIIDALPRQACGGVSSGHLAIEIGDHKRARTLFFRPEFDPKNDDLVGRARRGNLDRGSDLGSDDGVAAT